MSILGVVRALARRWYVLAVFAAITVVAALFAPVTAGVYSSQVTVVFLPPVTPDNPNALTPTPEDLVDFTAVVERAVNGSAARNQFASANATLSGAGVRQGSNVRLVNDGGQWTSAFSDPVLVIDVVDATEEEVRAEVERSVAAIEIAARDRQAAVGVPEASRITTLQSPSEAVVGYTAGNRQRATVGILTLGALVGTGVALFVDSAASWLRRRRGAATAPSAAVRR